MSFDSKCHYDHLQYWFPEMKLKRSETISFFFLYLLIFTILCLKNSRVCSWFSFYSVWVQITAAARFKSWTVFDRSNTGVVGSNPTRGVDVYMRLFSVYVVLCVGRGLATGWSSVQGVIRTEYRLRNKKKKNCQVPINGCRTRIECLSKHKISRVNFYGRSLPCNAIYF
jgi:hypothetical protein